MAFAKAGLRSELAGSINQEKASARACSTLVLADVLQISSLGGVQGEHFTDTVESTRGEPVAKDSQSIESSRSKYRRSNKCGVEIATLDAFLCSFTDSIAFELR